MLNGSFDHKATASPCKRILVTGGAGFIGSHTVNFLLNQGHSVVVLDNLTSGKLENLTYPHPGLEWIEGDVLEFPLVEEIIAGCDAVLHLAAISSVPYSIAHPIYSFQINTQGFLHVLEAIRRMPHAIRFVYASSAAVYGDAKQLPCQDDQALSAVLSPYALQKLNSEQYASLYRSLHGINSLGLRYFNVYGSKQDPSSPYSGVISQYLNAYQQDRALMIFGDGQQSRDFIYVEDVVKANCLALQSDFNGVLNIATGQSQTLLHLIECIEEAGSKPAKREFAPPRAGDVRASYAAVDRAKLHLGFHAKTSLKDGIKKLYQEIAGV